MSFPQKTYRELLWDFLEPTRYGSFFQYAPRPVGTERFPSPSTRGAESLPKITIVTPSYNQCEYLPATIESVLRQKGVRLDYIVMDGGSSDESPREIAKYDAQLKYWCSRKDGGQSSAVRQGFEHMDCGADDILAYLNSDDVLLPGVLRFVAEYFDRHPEVDAVYGHRIVIDSHGDEVSRWFTPAHDASLLTWVDLIPQETLFWRRRLYDKVGGVDPSFQFALDWDLLIRFQEAGALMQRLPYVMACFRVHDQSKTVQASSSIGARECAHLRERLHGRSYAESEVQRWFLRANVQSYFLRKLWNLGIRW